MPAPHTPLTVCVIARNEERFIARCLDSVRPVADQVVVLDTGSTDRTVELALAAGAEVHHFAWCNDFAAARNAVLAHARGTWVLMLDADEELPPDQHAALRRHLEDTGAAAFRLPIVNVGEEALGASYVPRLFRNVPGARYTGRIHEQVFPSILAATRAAGLVAKLGEARLLHHGYTAAVTRERDKVGRNLRLLLLAVGERPHDANLRLNLGLERVRAGDLAGGLGDYAEAARMLAAADPAEVSPELRETLLTQFATHLLAAGRTGEVVELLASPLATAGGLTSSLELARGLALWQRREFAAAARAFEACIATRNAPGLTPAHADIHTAVPHHCLARCLDELGDPAGARAAFAAGQAIGVKAEALRLDYARHLVRNGQPVEALQLLHGIVTGQPTTAEAWLLGAQIALSRPEFLEVAQDWTAEATRLLPGDHRLRELRAEVLLLAEQPEPSLELWNTVADGSTSGRTAAAILICQLTAESMPATLPSVHADPGTNQAAIDWYRRLVDFGAGTLVRRLHSRLDTVGRVLPLAGRVLAELDSQVTPPSPSTPPAA